MGGLKQADLARRAGISASYLNLIEHNRRRIGGKLLLDIAEALDVEPAMLAEGAEATLIAGLREAASDLPQLDVELDRIDEFAGRFPGWAELLAERHKRVMALERTVAALTDRLTHDPHLAARLHDMLTTVTAIRSTASILADSDDIEPEWQARFHRNINEDSARLAETSQELVRYLDAVDDRDAGTDSPQEEVDALLASHRFSFDEIEQGSATPEDLADRIGGELSTVARRLLRAMLEQSAADTAAVPYEAGIAALRSHGPDPFALAPVWGCDPGLAMRRIAVLADPAGLEPVGLAVCDASGTLTYRQPLDSLPLARFGAGCTMLPLYRALSSPMLPITTLVRPTGRIEERFRAYAYASPLGPLSANMPPLLRAQMLIVPAPAASSQDAAVEVGVSCRICPRPGCPGRREPSVLSRGL